MDETKKYSHDVLSTQLAYRRDRRHNIFAWCSTILVAIVGGVVATITQGHNLTQYEKIIITFTILILAGFTTYWINYHWKIERVIQQKLSDIQHDLALTMIGIQQHHADWLQTLAVIGLAATALTSLWWKQIRLTLLVILVIVAIAFAIWNQKEFRRWWSEELFFRVPPEKANAKPQP